MQIAQAKPDDWNEILTMARAFHAEDGHPMSAKAEESLKKAFEPSPYVQVFVIRENGVIAGYGILCYSWSIEFGGMTSYLDDFYMKPDFRGRGLGTMAMEAFEDMSRAKGCCIFHLETEAANTKAKAFYLERGMEDTGRSLLIRKL
jgi:ribosomal protein S18 acetylase RimI-like enzyme